MAKESGIGWTTCSIDDSAGTLRAIINDVTQLQFAMPRGVQDVTGLDKSAIERLLLLADFSATLTYVFNDAASTGAHTVLKTIPSTSVIRTFSLAVSGQTLSNEVIASDLQYNRAQSGELTATVPLALADGAVPTWS
ncbi:MAG: hypothetical protein ABW046_22500 [Actinoplanes sp.]